MRKKKNFPIVASRKQQSNESMDSYLVVPTNLKNFAQSGHLPIIKGEI